MSRSVPALLAKLAQHRPRVVCFVGKCIWLAVERALRPPRVKFVFGLQPCKVVHGMGAETLLFVVPCTSGRVVSHKVRVVAGHISPSSMLLLY